MLYNSDANDQTPKRHDYDIIKVSLRTRGEDWRYKIEWEGFLYDHPHLKVGTEIELEGDSEPGRKWKVIAVADITSLVAFIKEGWNNNV